MLYCLASLFSVWNVSTYSGMHLVFLSCATSCESWSVRKKSTYGRLWSVTLWLETWWSRPWQGLQLPDNLDQFNFLNIRLNSVPFWIKLFSNNMRGKKGCADSLLWTENVIILVFTGCIFSWKSMLLHWTTLNDIKKTQRKSFYVLCNI